MVPTLGVGALSKLRTLRIGSGGTACMCVWGGGIYIFIISVLLSYIIDQ